LSVPRISYAPLAIRRCGFKAHDSVFNLDRVSVTESYVCTYCTYFKQKDCCDAIAGASNIFGVGRHKLVDMISGSWFRASAITTTNKIQEDAQ
jgi:hypothetical protein